MLGFTDRLWPQYKPAVANINLALALAFPHHPHEGRKHRLTRFFIFRLVHAIAKRAEHHIATEQKMRLAVDSVTNPKHAIWSY
jgi:hypothetical protein